MSVRGVHPLTIARLFVLLALTVSLLVPGGAPALASNAGRLLPEVFEPDPLVAEMIAQVDSTTVYTYAGGLSGEWPVSIGGESYTIATRYSRAEVPIAKATQYVYEHFQSLGLSPQFHEYELPSSGTRRNVIAEQRGATQPERVFLLGAHLDSTSNDSDAYTYAPGADDNASGSVGVLVIAEILSRYTFNCTLRYALFTGEEQGLYGSRAYAQSVAEAGEGLEAVLNLDMIGYNSDEAPLFELHTRVEEQNAGDLDIANLFVNVIEAYDINLTPEIVASGLTASDHASFWDQGYPAILAIEDMQDFNPYYHSDDDRLETLDLAYFTKAVQAALGTMAHLGCGVQPQGTLAGSLSDASTGAALAGAQVEAAGQRGRPATASTSANGSYVLSLNSGSYEVRASQAGYLPAIVSGVQITSNMTTTLDIALEPCSLPVGLDFTYSPAYPYVGDTVAFTATLASSGSLPVDFEWAFGDEGVGAGTTVTHTFSISDVFPVNLTALNCAGSIASSHPVPISLRAYVLFLPIAAKAEP